jgi:4-hydroxy-tetrahydrodipicolinate synthase
MLAGRFEEAVEVYRWYMPLLHLDTHVKLVQYIKLANAECGFGSEMVRAPRLPLVEPERSQILAIIRQAIATRPTRVPGDTSRPHFSPSNGSVPTNAQKVR